MYIHVDPDSTTGKIIIVLGTPLFTAFLCFQGINFVRAYESTNWPSVRGTIIASAVDRDFGLNGPRSIPEVQYEYQVGPERFQNDRIAFGLFRGMLTWGHADRKVSKFPQGRIVAVYYDPGQPRVSCLETGGIGWEDIFMLFVSGSGVVMGVNYFRRFIERFLGLDAQAQRSNSPSQSTSSAKS